LKEHNIMPAIAASAAGFLLGVLGLMRAYRITLRFYLGAETMSAARRDAKAGRKLQPGDQLAAAHIGRPLLVERRIPWLREDAAALTLATLRSLLRAPELKMALIMPIVMAAVMS